jgi:hypothetical protein
MKAVVKLKNYLWRPLTDCEADTDFVIGLRNDERFNKWFYNRVTREGHKKFVSLPERRQEINWVIERDGKPIGASSIYHVDFGNRKAEVGRIVMIDPRMFFLNWVVSAHVADVCVGLNKLYIEMLENHSAIAGAVERLGMVREGLLRHHMIVNNTPVNVLVFGNTRPDWERMRASMFDRFGTPEVISYEGERVEPLRDATQQPSVEQKEVAL